jgi:ATP-dependent helicase/nuclease subunit B
MGIIEEAVKNPGSDYIVLVPDQFTMQTQKDMIRLHPSHGMMNIDVLSFTRLAFHVFEEVGGNERKVLEDTGKNLVLRKVAEDKKQELRVLGNNLKKQGFVNELKSMISEFCQYSITEKELNAMIAASEAKPLLASKLRDIKILYDGFKDYIRENYITAEEILDVLSEVIEKSERIKRSTVCLDGFTGFTPTQYKLIKKLLVCCEKVIVTITIDQRENPYKMDGEHRLFHLSKITVNKLQQIAKECQAEREKDYFIKGEPVYRYRNNEALAFLEKYLFRYKERTYEKFQDDIQIHLCQNPVGEIEYAVREIYRLVREEGYQYREIAVVASDIEVFGEYAKKVLKEAKIPCFIDSKRSIFTNPFVEMLRAALLVIEKDFSYETVFRYLRTGLAGVETEEIDEIENYVLALGIRGSKKWEEKWIRQCRKKRKADLESVNAIREKVIEPLLPLREVLKNRENDVKKFTGGIYEFIRGLEIQMKLKMYEDGFGRAGDFEHQKEYSQVYKIVIELFDKIVELLGEEKISLKEYIAILDSGLEEAKVGLIPPGIDEIVLGDIERTRLKDIRALFFLGVNDGLIPKVDASGGLLSQFERELFEKEKIELAPTARQSAYTQRLYLYLNLTKPSEKLYLSYSKVNNEGKSVRPSYLIGVLLKMFPALLVADEEKEMEQNYVFTTPKESLSYFINGLNHYVDTPFTGTETETDEKERKKGWKEECEIKWKELYFWYQNQDEWKPKIKELIEAKFYENDVKGIGKAVAGALYGSALENSVTRLEQYASCAFAHFLGYGLELTSREKYEFEPVDIGNIFHNALEVYSKKLRESEYDWVNIPEAQREKFVKEGIREVTVDYGNTILLSSARNAYMVERVERILLRTVWALGEQVKRGKFVPEEYEISFSTADRLDAAHFELSEEEILRLRGRIDRIDVCEAENKLYIKVIDYKSGNARFDMIHLYYGLQLQLVVYMNAAAEIEKRKHPDKEIIPAGILYYNLKDPIVDKEEGDTQEDLREKIMKELKMNGLITSDKEIIQLMDGQAAGKSDILPVAFNKDGSISRTSNVASREQFRRLSSYVREKIEIMGKEILEGKIEINPYLYENRTACDFCPYGSVCGFDTGVKGYRYRRLKKFQPEEVWEKLEGIKEERKGGVDG